MVSTRSSGRLLKKAKLDNDRIVETAVNVRQEDDDDFQEPLLLPRRSVRFTRTTRATKTKVVSEQATIVHAESSHSAVTFTTEELEAEVEGIIQSVQVEQGESIHAQPEEEEEVDELTEESGNEADITLTLDEPIVDLVVQDLPSNEDESEPIVDPEPIVERPRGRRATRMSVVKYLFFFTCFFLWILTCPCYVVQKNTGQNYRAKTRIGSCVV